MLIKKHILIFITLLLVLVSCNTAENEPRSISDGSDGSVTKINNDHPIDQSFMNEAKDFVLKKKEVTEIRGVNTKEDILMGIKVTQLQQFNEQDIESEIKKSLEKKYPNKKIEISSDEKIFIELNKLEKEIEKNSLSKKELEKRFKDIMDLINDPA